jgi:hypothetical protein
MNEPSRDRKLIRSLSPLRLSNSKVRVEIAVLPQSAPWRRRRWHRGKSAKLVLSDRFRDLVITIHSIDPPSRVSIANRVSAFSGEFSK